MAKIPEDEKVLVLGALLHDIGKLTYLTERPKKKHEISGARFINEILVDYDKDIALKVKQRIEAHHNPKDDHDITNLIKEADHLSSGERADHEDDEDAGEDSRKREKTMMIPVFNEVILDDKKVRDEKGVIDLATLEKFNIINEKIDN